MNRLCAALICIVSATAHAQEFAAVKTVTGCNLTVQAYRQFASTYTWDGECPGGKAEGMGTYVQKVRAEENLFDLYYSTQTRHAGAAYGYMTTNATRRDPSLEFPEKVSFQFDGARIAFTKGWGWSLDGLVVGGQSISLPRPVPPAPFPSMLIQSPTRLLTLQASTCATDVSQTAACKGVSERYRTIYLIREYDIQRNLVTRPSITPCPDIFDIASCHSLLAQKSTPLRAEILAFLERAKPSVDDLLGQARASRPGDRPLPAAAQVPPPLAHAEVARATPGVVDAALPVFDTQVPYPSRLGKMLWLDANTLAITTSKDKEFWDGTTVAVDVGARATSVILERGFLNCTNDGLVAMIKGSLARQYAGGFLKPGAPDPVFVFYRWNAKAKRLESEEPASKPTWNWQICAQTRAEDIRLASISFYDRNIRYLNARDGVLEWKASVPKDDAVAVFLAKPNAAPIPVDVAVSDIITLPSYLPFSDQYLLTAGRFMIGGKMDHKGKMVDQLPAITMTRGGRVSRQTLPASLKTVLDSDTLGGGGQTLPTAAGLLVSYGGRPAQGGGLYISNAGGVKRVWCVPSVGYGEPCALESLEVSPDGCQIAFVPSKAHPMTVKIIRLCASPGEK